MVKNLPARQEMRVWSLGHEDPLEEEMTTHSSILAWRIPWTEMPGRLQYIGSQSVCHDWTHTHTSSVSSVVRRRASWLHTGLSHLEADRQACNSQNQKARGCCNLSPREGIFYQTVSRLQLLTMSSWDVGCLTSARRVVAWDQLSRGDRQHMHIVQKKRKLNSCTI